MLKRVVRKLTISPLASKREHSWNSPLFRLRGIFIAECVVFATLTLTGCSLFGPKQEVWQVPPDQPGVLRVAQVGSGGYIRLEFAQGDFQATSLKLDPGPYTIVVANVDHPGSIGFFMSKPDRWGRERTDGHVATGGGITRGEERVFEVELLPESTYLFSDPVTQSPSHQILTGPALPGMEPKVAIKNSMPEADSADETEESAEITSDESQQEITPPVVGAGAFNSLGLDGVVPEEAADAPPVQPADVNSEAATTDEEATKQEEEKDPLVTLLPPTPGHELPGDKKPDPPSDDDIEFSPEVEKLLEAFDKIEQ